MDSSLPRRDFLKATPVAAGMLALAASDRPEVFPEQDPASVRIGSRAFKPREDFPIRPKAFWEVRMTDDFWRPKLARNAEVTIPFELQKATESGSTRGIRAGVLEGAIFTLQTNPEAPYRAQVEARIRELSDAPARGNGNFEIAASWFRATGDRRLLDHSIRAAAALYEDFRVNNPPFSGGERDALNCVQLFRVTHDRRHLELAKHYLDSRGLANSVGRSRHNQSYRPVTEQREAVGHAVNCVTLMTSLVDVGVLTGLDEYLEAARHMWRDAVARKLYLTGGVGATGNEGFGEPYSLPNISAYAETCAVLMFMTLNHRLFLATGDGQYLDVLERGLYNNALSGISTTGDHYFYVNRLASAGDGRDTRWQRASLECCPPNLVRFLASMPGYLYAQDARGAIYVNLYASSEAAFRVNGRELALTVDSGMPWDGRTRIGIRTGDVMRGTVRLRIPGWARGRPVPGGLYSYLEASAPASHVAVNGHAVSAEPDRSGYVSITRDWRTGDVIDLEFPIETRRVVADTRVRADRGRLAIERGPIVYCAEWPDCEGGAALDLLVSRDAELHLARDAGLFDGVPVLRASAASVRDSAAPAKSVTLIPYHLWANRGPGEMTVWLSAELYRIGDSGPAGGFIFYENPNYARDGWRYLEAAPWDQSAGAPWGCFRRLIEGARGTAIGTGRQNTADIMAACHEPGTAAHLCATLSINGVRGWFLPSRDELTALYRNLYAQGLGNFQDCGATDNFTYWTSSQQTADMAAHTDFPDNGRLHGDDKDFPRRVRAIRAL